MTPKHHAGLVFIFCTLLGGPVRADVSVSGYVHVSGDAAEVAGQKEASISSNASLFSLQGSQQLDYGLKGLFRLETQLDVTGESTALLPRNRYVGVMSRYGLVLVGNHDTPFKSLVMRVNVFPNTLADARNLLGNASGEDVMNRRARNAVMYVAPQAANIEWRILHSSGSQEVQGRDTYTVTSTSLTYLVRDSYFGIAMEDQAASDARGFRLGAGLRLGNTRLNAMLENLSSGFYQSYERRAYGFSVDHTWDRWTHVKGQMFTADNFTGRANSSASLFSLGVTRTLARKLELYVLAAMVNNGRNADFGLGGVDHGDALALPQGRDREVAANNRVMAGSLGLEYRF